MLGFYWKIGLSSISSYNYNKVKGEDIYSSTGSLVLSQLNYSPNNGKLLSLMFSNLTDFSMPYGAPLYLPPSFCHRIKITYPKIQLYRLISLSEVFFWELLNVMQHSAHDCCPVYSETSVDAAVGRLLQ